LAERLPPFRLVTRGPQWVRLADGIELLDTPGVMLPGRLGPETLLSLAVTGTINEEVLPEGN
jgi:ribosome biogenesis GTPase A